MAETAMTYSQLDEGLRALGFTVRTVEGKARIYKHSATGASVFLPDTDLGDSVIPHHLNLVRSVLNEFDIAAPMDLTSKPQKAS